MSVCSLGGNVCMALCFPYASYALVGMFVLHTIWICVNVLAYRFMCVCAGVYPYSIHMLAYVHCTYLCICSYSKCGMRFSNCFHACCPQNDNKYCTDYYLKDCFGHNRIRRCIVFQYAINIISYLFSFLKNTCFYT